MNNTTLLALLLVLRTTALAFQVIAPTRNNTAEFSAIASDSGIFGDAIIYPCTVTNSSIQLLVRNPSSGLYEKRDLIIDQVTQSPDIYCPSYFSDYETNGKLFYYNGGSAPTLLFTLDENYNAVNVLEVPYYFKPILGIGVVRYAQDTLLVLSLVEIAPGYFEGSLVTIDFVNNEWKVTFLNVTDFPDENTINTAFTNVYRQNERVAISDYVVSFRSRQDDGTWPYALYKDASYLMLNQYEDAVGWSSIFNGHDIISFATRGNEEITGGKLYLFKVNGNSLSIDASFDIFDLGLEDTYLVDQSGWTDEPNQPHLYWLNKDVLAAYTDWTNWIDEEGEYYGRVIIVSRDEDGKWKYGGCIRFPDGQRIKMYDMDPTLSDLVIRASDTNTSYTYFYPRCFMDPLQQVTCQQNVQLSSCDPNNPPAIDNIYSYTDDGCGEPEAIVKDASLNNNVLSVNVRLERFGVKVGSCTATFNCPVSNNGPSSQVSSASLSNLRRMLISIVLGLIIALF